MEISTNDVTEVTSNSALCGGTITGDLEEYIPIIDRLIKNKFQLFSRTRQIIVSDIENHTFDLKPMKLFEDLKQNKKFVLTSMSFDFCTDQVSIELNEYDNESEIDLITT